MVAITLLMLDACIFWPTMVCSHSMAEYMEFLHLTIQKMISVGIVRWIVYALLGLVTSAPVLMN